MAIIEIKDLTKDYGSERGIFDINLEINEGEMVGFVGTNGAGKTTTIRSIMGFIKPDKGSSKVKDKESRKYSSEIVKDIGYVPGEIAFPDLKTGTAFLKSQAEFIGLKDMSYANELIKALQLDPKANLKRMSKGMKQKTALVAALMGNPSIIILDEPTTGLDPLMRAEFLEIIKKEHAKGKTIFMSTNTFEELEGTCDRVALIDKGRIVDVVDMKKITDRLVKDYKIEFTNKEDFSKFFEEKYKIIRVQEQYNQVTVELDKAKINQLMQSLSKYSIRLFVEVKYTIEDYFKNTMSEESKPVEANDNGRKKN